MKNVYKRLRFNFFSSIVFICGFYFFGCSSNLDDSHNFFVESSVDTTLVSIGDIITYTVFINGVSDQKVKLSELIVNDPLEIRNKSINEEGNKIEFQIVCWDTGRVIIPGYSVEIQNLNDTTLNYSLHTDSISIEVISMLDGRGQETLKPLKDPVPMKFPIPWKKIGQWSLLIITFISLIFAWSRREFSHSFAPTNYKTFQSPLNRAIERIEQLKDIIDDKYFYVEISHIIRETNIKYLFIKTDCQKN